MRNPSRWAIGLVLVACATFALAVWLERFLESERSELLQSLGREVGSDSAADVPAGASLEEKPENETPKDLSKREPIEPRNEDSSLETDSAEAAVRVEITGCVLSAGAPLPGCRLTLRITENGTDPELRSDLKSLGALSREDGTFRLEAALRKIPRKCLVLHVVKAGYLPGNVTLQSGLQADVGAISLEAAGGFTGRVRDRGGKPIQGAEVRFNRLDPRGKHNPPFPPESYVEFPEWTVKTDAEGRFLASSLPEGPMTVAAVHPDYLPAGLAKVRPKKDVIAKLPDIVLEPGLVIAGAVSDEKGSPVAGADVFVKERDFERRPYELFHKDNWTHTDEQGAFEVTGLRENPYEVRVLARGYPTVSVHEVNAGTRDMEIVLTPGRCLGGIVFDGNTKAEIPDFELDIGITEGNPAVLKGEDAARRMEDSSPGPGAYFVEGLPFSRPRHPTSCTLEVSAKGYGTRRVHFEDSSTEETAAFIRRDVELKPECRVAGRVLTAEGNPVPGAGVNTVHSGDFFFSGARCAPDGTFEVFGLAEGTVQLTAGHPDYMPSDRITLTLKSGEVVRGVEFRLLPRGGLEGLVFDVSGKPKAAAVVVAGTRQSATDDRGRYRIDRLEPGEYYVHFSGERILSVTDELRQTDMGRRIAQVLPGAVTRLDLEEPVLGSIEGFLDVDGRPARDRLILLTALTGMGKGGSIYGARTTAEGFFKFSMLEPAMYRISFQQDSLQFPVTREVELEPGASASIRLSHATPRGWIWGSVLNGKTGEPLTAIWIKLESLSETGEAEAPPARSAIYESVAEGRFVFLRVPPGRYLLSAKPDSKEYAPDEGREIVMRADEEIHAQDILLQPAP